MKDQITLTDVEYGNRKKTTKREEFLNKMEEIIPWKAWVEMIRPYYPKGEHGRPVRGIETMLRMYLMQTWFNLSDEGTEDAIYDSYAMRSFLGINFMTEQVPDATTLLKFRHLLEKHNIGEKIFTDIRDRLEESGLLMHGGTIVDATIIICSQFHEKPYRNPRSGDASDEEGESVVSWDEGSRRSGCRNGVCSRAVTTAHTTIMYARTSWATF